MSFIKTPQINVGRTVSIPAMNPTVRLPAGGGVNLGLPLTSTASTTAGNYAPLGDWRTPLGLTADWGKINTPVTSWFTNPSPFIQGLSSTSDTIKNLQPIVPTNQGGSTSRADPYVAPKPFDINAYLKQMNSDMMQQYGPRAPIPAIAPRTTAPVFNVARPATAAVPKTTVAVKK